MISLCLGGLLLAGCGAGGPVTVGDSSPRVTDAYDGPMHVPVDSSDHADVLQRSGAAGRALECRAAPYLGGSGDYDSGLESAQDDAESALEDFLASEFFSLPRDGYRVERDDGDRVLFSYDVDGRTKIAFITSDDVRDFDGESGWGVETWAQCDPSELPDSVSRELGTQVWYDEAGNRVPVTRIQSWAGPEHCDWQDIVFLTLGEGPDARQFLRDTDGELGRWQTSTFDARATLPEDAEDTGFEREGRRLWLHADGTAAYLVDIQDPAQVERWPGTKEPVACA